jgi:hypothetical protein
MDRFTSGPIDPESYQFAAPRRFDMIRNLGEPAEISYGQACSLFFNCSFTICGFALPRVAFIT